MQLKLAYTFKCATLESFQKAKEIALKKTNPDEIFIDTEISRPNGIENKVVRYRRVSDYFDKIELIENDLSFDLIFLHKATAPSSYWKDMMVQTLMAISKIEGVSNTNIQRVQITQ